MRPSTTTAPFPGASTFTGLRSSSRSSGTTSTSAETRRMTHAAERHAPRKSVSPRTSIRGPTPESLARSGRAALHHAAHASRRHGRCGRLLLRLLGHHRLGGEQEPRDRRRIEQRRAHHLGRIDDAGLEQILVLDRKSTRLNSSHGYISYAVFCLKKKKRNKQ